MSATELSKISRKNSYKSRHWTEEQNDNYLYTRTIEKCRSRAEMGYDCSGNDIKWGLNDRVVARLKAEGYRLKRMYKYHGSADWQYRIFWGKTKERIDAQNEAKRKEQEEWKSKHPILAAIFCYN